MNNAQHPNNTRERLFYVTVARGSLVKIAAGPFDSHDAAEAQV